MPPATRVRAFLIVFTVLCLVALGLVLLAEFSGYQWAKRAVSVAQNFGRMVFAVVAVSFITVEGVPLMLAAWFRKEQIREAREEGIEIGDARGHIRGHAEGRTEADGPRDAPRLCSSPWRPKISGGRAKPWRRPSPVYSPKGKAYANARRVAHETTNQGSERTRLR